MVDCVEQVHKLGYVHRDIKADNFRVENGNVKIIDLGSAKEYRDSKGNHVECINKKLSVGTPATFSVFSHEGWELSRRDDIISLVYTFLMLSKKGVPWSEDLKLLTEQTDKNYK